MKRMEPDQQTIQPYQKLLDAMDAWDDPKPIESLRERVIRAVHKGNTLPYFATQAGHFVVNIGPRAFSGINIGNTTKVNVGTSTAASKKKKEKDEEEKKEERAGFFVIVTIAALTFGSMAAFGYSAKRLSEVTSAKRDTDELLKQVEQDNTPFDLQEALDCHNTLKKELHAAQHALGKEVTYYKAMTLATFLLALSVGAFAYDKLYRRSYLAYQTMVGSFVASAAILGFGMMFCGPSREEVNAPLSVLYVGHQWRRYLVSLGGQTRYEGVKQFNPHLPTQEPVPVNAYTPQGCSGNYPDLYEFLSQFPPPKAPSN